MELNIYNIIFINILMLFGIQSNSLSEDLLNDSLNQYMFELKQSSNLNSKEKLCIFFIPMYECSKCVQYRNVFFDCLADSIDKSQYLIRNFKIIGLLKSMRNSELSYYIKRNHWKYPLLIERVNFKKIFNIGSEALFVIINFDGKVLFQFPDDITYNFIGLCSKLQEIILKD